MMIETTARRLCLGGGALLAAAGAAIAARPQVPAEAFDLAYWNLTLPADADRDGKPDTVSVRKLRRFSHPDFFHLDADGHLVFAAPNKAATTRNSTNTRSELREMLRGTKTRIRTHGGGNNWAVAARNGADGYARIGGRLDATLRVDHVSRNAGRPEAKPAYSAVVGQIHAVGYDDTSSGFGYGNEPIKIYYKKWPEHETGSVFWTYERNLAKDDPARRDLAYPVFGHSWESPDDPGAAGIALGEPFSYTINVYRNTMYLTFESERLGTVRYAKSLIDNVDPLGEVDEADNRFGYGGDSLYFKAGIYNQCSASTADGFWYPACPGTGDWATDRADGNYAQATFVRLTHGEATPPAAAPAPRDGDG